VVDRLLGRLGALLSFWRLAFVDLDLFHNRTYTGATISNFLLNGAAGTLLVSLQLLQLGGNMTAQQAGILTLGYAIAKVVKTTWRSAKQP